MLPGGKPQHQAVKFFGRFYLAGQPAGFGRAFCELQKTCLHAIGNRMTGLADPGRIDENVARCASAAAPAISVDPRHVVVDGRVPGRRSVRHH